MSSFEGAGGLGSFSRRRKYCWYDVIGKKEGEEKENSQCDAPE